MVDKHKLYWEMYIILIQKPENQPKHVTDEQIYEQLEAEWMAKYTFQKYKNYETFRKMKHLHYKSNR